MEHAGLCHHGGLGHAPLVMLWGGEATLLGEGEGPGCAKPAHNEVKGPAPHMAVLAEPMSRRLGAAGCSALWGSLAGRDLGPGQLVSRPTPTREVAGPAGPDFPVWGWTRVKSVTGQTCRPRSGQRGL